MEKGLVSVVIPTYNRVDTIERAIDSALMQDYSPLEVVVVGDGVGDEISELVLRRCREDRRVRYVWKENGGVCTARNRGLLEARGEFIAMLDDDDYWLPGKLQRQVSILERHPEVSLIWSDFDAVNPAGEVIETRSLRKMYHAYDFFPHPEDLFSSAFATDDGIAYYIGDVTWPMVLGNLVHTSTVVARAEHLKQAGWYDQTCHPAEDQDYYFRVCKTGPVAFVDSVTLHYSVGAADAATAPSQGLALAKSYLHVLLGILEKDGERICLPEGYLRTALCQGYRWAGHMHFEQGQMSEARRYFWQALKLGLDVQSVVFLFASLLPQSSLPRLRAIKRRLGLSFRDNADR
jgi:GT2 family glycosyltransferase